MYYFEYLTRIFLSVCELKSSKTKMNVTWKKIIASRGWHVYGKDKWQNPKKGEQLQVEIEKDPKALQFDPHSVAWIKKSRAKLTPDVVGHFPMEVSRFVFFFIKHGG